MPLRFAARNGLWLPLAFLALGVIFPAGGAAAERSIAAWACLLVFFGILTMSQEKIAATRTGLSRSDLLAALGMSLAASLLAPAFVYLACREMHVGRDLTAVMCLMAAAPIAQSAGPMAAILKLPDRSATFAALGTLLASPVVLWLTARLIAAGAMPLSPEGLAGRAILLGVVPAGLAFLLRFLMPVTVAAWRLEFRGLVIIALSMVAAARGPGLRYAVTVPWHAAWLCGLTLVVTLSSMFAGWLLTAITGRGTALRLAGMYSVGARNTGFAWAALAPALDAEGTLFVILMVLPFYILPLVMKRLVGLVRFTTPLTEAPGVLQ